MFIVSTFRTNLTGMRACAWMWQRIWKTIKCSCKYVVYTSWIAYDRSDILSAVPWQRVEETSDLCATWVYVIIGGSRTKANFTIINFIGLFVNMMSTGHTPPTNQALQVCRSSADGLSQSTSQVCLELNARSNTGIWISIVSDHKEGTIEKCF